MSGFCSPIRDFARGRITAIGDRRARARGTGEWGPHKLESMTRLPERVDGALGLAAAGGVLLLISLFLDWYQPGLSAIEVFEITDLLLAGLAIGAVTLALRATTAEPGYEDPRTDWLAAIGIAATVIVLWEIVDNPPAVAGNAVEAGAWLGFIGAVAIAFGSLLWSSRVSLVLTLRPRESTDDAAEPAPIAAGPQPDDPATGEEDVAGVEPYEPGPARSEPAPPPAEETEIESRTEQHPAAGGESGPRPPR